MICHTIGAKVRMIGKKKGTLRLRGIHDIQRKDTLALQDI
jgi:hypothetical protein